MKNALQHALKTQRALSINTKVDELQTGTVCRFMPAPNHIETRKGIMMNLKKGLLALCCSVLCFCTLNAVETPQEPVFPFKDISADLFPGEIADLINSNEYMMAWRVLGNSSQLSVAAYKDFLSKNPDGKSGTIYKEPIPRLRFLLAYIKWLEVEFQVEYQAKSKKVNDDMIKDLLFGKKKGEKRNNTGAYNFALEVFAKYPASDAALAAGELCQKISAFVKSRYGMELNPNKGGRDEVVRKLHQNKPTKGLSEIISTMASESQGRMLSDKKKFEEYLAQRESLAMEKSVIAIQKRGEGMRNSTFELKGFYLGMPITDARTLVKYYLPNAKVVITKDNNLEIDPKPRKEFLEIGRTADPQEMYFCQADKLGKVWRLNFDKRFLKKWFSYDVQDWHEWASEYGREFKFDFRKITVKRDVSNDHYQIYLNYSQPAYRYRHNKKGFVVSYYGKMKTDGFADVHESDLFAGGFRAEKVGFAMGADTKLREYFENGDGAKEGTLRVEVLKD